MISKEQIHRSHLLQVYTTSKDIQRAPQLTSLLPKSMLVTSHPENISDSQNTCYQNAHLAYHIQRLPHPLLHGMHDLTSHQRVTPHPRTISYLLQVVHASEHTATTIIKCMNNQPHISMTKGRPGCYTHCAGYVSAKCQARRPHQLHCGNWEMVPVHLHSQFASDES